MYYDGEDYGNLWTRSLDRGFAIFSISGFDMQSCSGSSKLLKLLFATLFLR
jgi:hypothetical protein